LRLNEPRERLCISPSVLDSKMDRFIRRARPYIPFTPPNLAWQVSDKKVKSILDVGCGTGEPMKFFKRHGRFFAVGIDVHYPYLKECKAKVTHDQYVLCDARRLPFKRESFELILCLELLEHLEKQAGKELIGAIEDISRYQLIISTPVGERMQKPYHNNPYQEHKSRWLPDEFTALEFTVRGLGLPNVSSRRITDCLPKCLRLLVLLLWVIASPFTYFFPELGGSMVCSKKLNRVRAKRSER